MQPRPGLAELTTTILSADDERDLLERTLKTSGCRLDLSSPFVAAVLAAGWHVNIHKYVVKADHLHDSVALGTLPRQAARFLEAAVVSGLNILGPVGPRPATRSSQMCPQGLGAAPPRAAAWHLKAPLYPRPNHSADERADDRCHEGAQEADEDVLSFVHASSGAIN